MVRLKVKVGPKGQIIIPKMLRKKYGIKENDQVFLEIRENEIAIRSPRSIEETLNWIRERRKRIRGREARLGDLADVDLEEEFD
ncbi:MAG: AbrB/MazE/SpoVT family DNA-binding domain-containing protein [Candidatus Korarchaeota archaeon]|nr:AbrB/MazE/SpoVT family DNA-binding domain-containing protein [Candidatus Korarchaeota archaeon]